jgi:hypothetical protein
MPQRLTPEIITAAIAGFEQQKHQIDAQIAELRAMLPGGNTNATTSEGAPPRRKRFSAAARRKMALAQKARWAKIRGDQSSPVSPPEPAKPKRKLSAAGRRAISEATKKRWALKRAEAAKAQHPKKSTTAGKTASKALKRVPVRKAAKSAPPTAQSAG